MKKFEPNNNSVYIPPTFTQSTPTNQFDLTKLLQILPKLNLDSIFNGKNNTNKQNQQNLPQFRQDIMRAENLKKATTSIQNHRDFVKKINEQK